jgi:Protein of unknown function (DUF1064)
MTRQFSEEFVAARRAKFGRKGADKPKERSHGPVRQPKGHSQRKYRNVPTVVDGIRFDSKKEAARYQELRLLEQAGIIRNLIPNPEQPKKVVYPLEVNGIWICDFIPDFTYEAPVWEGWETRCSDAKGMTTGGAHRLFKIKADLLEALTGIRTVETAT